MTDIVVEVVEDGDLAVATVQGEVDVGNTAVVKDRILGELSQDVSGVVLDLAAVRYIDSTGIRMIFELARTLRSGRRALAISLPAESPLHRLFDVTNVRSVASISTTLEQAKLNTEQPSEEPSA